jgi:ABC-type multidrug transport system fused ATPase/permease subunit
MLHQVFIFIYFYLYLFYFSCKGFFDTTPLGRVLNRFSGDLTHIDQSLFMLLMQVISIWLQLAGNVVIISVDTVWFLAIGILSLL